MERYKFHKRKYYPKYIEKNWQWKKDMKMEVKMKAHGRKGI